VRLYGVRLTGEAETKLASEALRRGVKPTSAARELILEALAGVPGSVLDARLANLEATLLRLEHELPSRIAALVREGPLPQAAQLLEDNDAPPTTDGAVALSDWILRGKP